jgi:hypothetical protein
VKRRIALAAAVVILDLAVCGPVFAQPVPAYPGTYPAPYAGSYAVLPPFEIVTIVRSKGFEPLNRPARQGSLYWVRAADRTGREMHVAVDARAGHVLRVIPSTRIGGMSPPSPIPGGRTVPDGNGPSSRLEPYPESYPDPADEMAPRERSAPLGPTGSPAPPPTASGRSTSARAPLPRPRPETPSLSASAEGPSPGAAPPNPAPALAEIDE